MSEAKSRPVLIGVVWACVWVHLALGTLVVGFFQLVVNDRRRWDGPEKWSGLGLLDRWAVFSLENPHWYFLALLTADVAALVLLWRAFPPVRRRVLAWCYFTWVALVALMHIGSSVYVNFVAGPIRLPGATITGGGLADVLGIAVMDSVVVCPAVLVAFALWCMRARTDDLCATCGYDLEGLKDELCPECGAVRAQSQQV